MYADKIMGLNGLPHTSEHGKKGGESKMADQGGMGRKGGEE